MSRLSSFLLLLVLPVAAISTPVNAQSQQGSFTATAPGNGNTTAANITPPSDVPDGTKVTITKVEQQLVGGGFADITDAVTICNNETDHPQVRFGEDVDGETFRYTYSMNNSSPGGDDPNAAYVAEGTSTECPAPEQ